MSTTVNLQDEKGRFIFYLGVTLLTGSAVAHLFFRMWSSGAHEFLLNTLNVPLASPGGESLQLTLMLVAGIFSSLLILFANDWRKRYQGYILIAGSLLVLLLLSVFGIGLFTGGINLLSGLNIGAFVLGLIIGLMTELREIDDGVGGDLTQIDFRHRNSTWANWVTTEPKRQTPAEFPVAYKGLVGIIVAVVLVANVFNLIYNQILGEVIVHAVASSILLYSLYSLLDINAKPSEQETNEVQFEVLGPQQSGKTYLALGLNLSIKNHDAYEIEGFDGRMPDIVEEHSNRITGTLSGLIDWGIGNTMIDAAEKVIIEFKKTDKKRGKLLTATVSMYDYPGEVLEDLADEYNEKRGKKMTDGGESTESESNNGDSDNLDQNEKEDDGDGLGTIDQITGGGDDQKESQDQVTLSPAETEVKNDTRAVDDGPNETENTDNSDSDKQIDNKADSSDDESSDMPLGTLDDISLGDDPQVQSSEDDKIDNPESDVETPDIGDTTEDIHHESEEDLDDINPESDTDGLEDGPKDISDQSEGSIPNSMDIDDDEIEKVKDALAENVGSADKLVVLLDSQRFLTRDDIIRNDPGMMLKEMTQIVQGAGPDEIIPVATKADYFMENFDGITNDELPTDEEMAKFSEFVNQQFNNHPMAGNLLELADYPVFPVYFLTGKGEDGDHKLRVKDGQVHPIGYDKLINVVVGD